MTDEANSHWLSILQELTEGQTWLKAHLNVTVKSSWSIDPFGHSSVMPYLLKGAGFENLLIQRTHYEVKKHLARDRHLEFRWRQPWGKRNYSIFFPIMTLMDYFIIDKYRYDGRQRFIHTHDAILLVRHSAYMRSRSENMLSVRF